MNSLRIALRVELRKALHSVVLRTTTVLLVAGIAVLSGALVAATQNGNEQIIAQLGPLANTSGWALLIGMTVQITAAGALLAFGIALSWSFGREFSDGTIAGLFALPVSRPTIAVAKLGIYMLWATAVALSLTTLILVAGLVLDLGPVTAGVLHQLVRQATLTVMTGMLAVPAGWVATLGRGLLPGIATTLAILVTAQVSAIASPDTAAWLPFSIPALWALHSGTVHSGQLAIVAIVPIAFAILTCLAWHRLQLVR